MLTRTITISILSIIFLTTILIVVYLSQQGIPEMRQALKEHDQAKKTLTPSPAPTGEQ